MAANPFLMFKFKKIIQSLKALKSELPSVLKPSIQQLFLTHKHIFSTYHGSTHESEVDSGIELFDDVLQAGVPLRKLGLGGSRVTLVAW